MKSLAGSKRTAGTPFASPTKAAPSAKRSRTQYGYYDEEDSESFPEDQWSPEDMDSGSEMSLDGDEDQIRQPDSPSNIYAAGPRGPRYHEDPRNTERPLPANITYGRDLTNTKSEGCAGCSCSTLGKQCNASSCPCQGRAACHNPLTKLDLVALFGQEAVAVHPCFMSWIAKQPKTKLGLSTSMQSLFNLIFQTVSMLKEYQDDVTEPYFEWMAKWDRLTVSERDSDAGLVLKQELLRWGLTSRNLQSVYYSFCRGEGWVETDHEWHCRTCGECMEWREWHCANCNQCSYGLSLPCDNCGRDGDGSEDSGFNDFDEFSQTYW